jgi:SnoaL-like domain
MPEERNPLRAALDARDPEMLSQSLSPDVLVRSPILDVPFEGREEVTSLFSALYEVLGDVTYPFDLPGDPAVFMWRSDVGGEPLEGVDVYRLNDRGQVQELTVLMRPLPGVAAFSAATGPLLAKRLGGSPAAVRFGAAPTGFTMRMLARFAPRTLGMRNARRGGR